MKDPPDKYRCLKLPLSSILYKTDDAISNMDILQNAISRANDITTKTYFLLRLWILEKYHNDLAIPTITEDTISMCMKSINKSVLGQKPKGNNAVLLNEFQQLRNSSGNFSLEDGTNLSAVLDYYTTTMLTAIENNIKTRFFDYVKRFVVSYFKHLYKDQLGDKVFKKQFYKEINVVKNDIINNTLECDGKYHNWINEYRHKIVPREFDVSYYYDIKV